MEIGDPSSSVSWPAGPAARRVPAHAARRAARKVRCRSTRSSTARRRS